MPQVCHEARCPQRRRGQSGSITGLLYLANREKTTLRAPVDALLAWRA